MSVLLLHDGYDGVISAHSDWEAVERAKREYLAGPVTDRARNWWENFGPEGKLSPSRSTRYSSWAEFLSIQLKSVEEGFWVQEEELS